MLLPEPVPVNPTFDLRVYIPFNAGDTAPFCVWLQKEDGTPIAKFTDYCFALEYAIEEFPLSYVRDMDGDILVIAEEDYT